MSNISMNNQNYQRRVLNSMHVQPMSMLSNQCFVPLPPNQNQDRNPESKINLVFGLLRKNTARTNGIWKVIQSLINKIKKFEESTSMIDQIIERNKELEEKRMKNNKKRNEKKKQKRIIKKEEKEKKKKERQDRKDIKANVDEGKFKLDRSVNLNFNSKDFAKEKDIKNVESKNAYGDVFQNSRIDDLENSRTNLINKKKINNKKNNYFIENSRTNSMKEKKINKNKKINKDEISLNSDQLMDENKNQEDECSLQLNNKMDKNEQQLSRNGRNKQNTINLVNRFIFNNKNIFNSNNNWVLHTFIPLIEDVIDLNLYELDVSDYIRKIKSPPEFRKQFWQWWKKKDKQLCPIEIRNIIQKLSKDKDLKKIIFNK